MSYAVAEHHKGDRVFYVVTDIKPADQVLSGFAPIETGFADSPTNGLEGNVKPVDQAVSRVAPLDMSSADTPTNGLERSRNTENDNPGTPDVNADGDRSV